MALPTLRQLWDSHQGRLVDKWAHYLPIYERYFAKFRGTACRVLEIGVAHGGSLQLWREYFGHLAIIYGLDIDPRCKEYWEDQIIIYQADQSDAQFLSDFNRLDIVIDDGSHKLSDQQASLDALWPKLNPGGVYLVEDCHTGHVPISPTYGIFRHFYPWVAVFEKTEYIEPQRVVTGTPSRPLNADERAAYGAINAKYA